MAGLLDFLFQGQSGGGLLGNGQPMQLAPQGGPQMPNQPMPGLLGGLQGALNQIANPGLPQQNFQNQLALEHLRLQQQQANKPQFTTVGTDQFGNPLHGFADPNTRKVETYRVPADQGGPGAGAPGAGATGQEALSGVDKPTADTVKALAEGRMAFPAGFALKSPYWQKMLSLVSAYDPAFDAVNYNARSKTRNDFTSGTSAKAITSLNTVMGHLDSLDKAGEELNNFKIPAINTAVNFVEGAVGDPRYKKFEITKNAVADELGKVFRSSGMSDSEIRRWSETISSSNSPAQMKGVISQATDLLESRMSALGEQYNKGMGTTKDPIQLLSPKAQATWARLRGTAAPETGAKTPQAAQGGGDPLGDARAAIARGAPRDAVIQRLQQNGINPAGL